MAKQKSETFKLMIETGNDAFAGNPDAELARMLHRIAHELEQKSMDPPERRRVFDNNGNYVGFYSFGE